VHARRPLCRHDAELRNRRTKMNRRNFTKAIAVGLSTHLPRFLRGQRPKQLKIGLSTLAWNVSRTSLDNFELALKDTSELGYWGFETVAPIIEAWDTDGPLARLIAEHHVPLKAGYIDVNVTDPSLRKEHLGNVIRVAKLVKKHGGNYVVM